MKNFAFEVDFMKQKYAVIGHPIGHTMSPFIHKSLFELQGIEM